jgi:hypothetical protein
VDAVNTPGAEEEPDMSKGRVSEVGGGGMDEEEEPDATAVALDTLSASDCFSNLTPIFFRMGQSLVLWLVLRAESWHRRHLPLISMRAFR